MTQAEKKLFDICFIYQKHKPLLLTAKKILFFLPKVQKSIQTIIEILDTACPGE